MKPETLESLMIDRALNELSPEIAELLDAYLVQNPTAATSAAQLENVVQLARQAVAATDELPHPVPAPNLRRELRRDPWLDWFRIPRIELVRLAMGLALGLVLGWILPPLWRTSEVGRASSPVRYVMVDARPAATRNSASEFWSLAAVAAERQARSDSGRLARPNRLPWDSIFKTPRAEVNQ